MASGVQGALKMWSEVVRWRLGGAETYHLLLVAATLTISSITPRSPWAMAKATAASFLSPHFWAFWLVLLMNQALHLYATYFILKWNRELPIRRPSIRYQPLDSALRLATRVINPLQGTGNLKSTLVFLVASALSGGTFVMTYLDYRGVEEPAHGLGMLWGSLLGVLYFLHMMITQQDVLAFPIIFRKRIFAVKQALPKAARYALQLAAAASVLGILLGLRPRGGGLSWLFSRSYVAILAGMFVCAFCWYTGLHVLKIVFTEHVRFLANGEGDPLATLFGALNTKDPALKHAALLDLCQLAESQGQDAPRRAAIFADEEGAAWSTAARFCLGEVSNLVSALGAALQSPATAAAQRTAPAPRWNALPQAFRAAPPVGRPQEEAAFLLATLYQRVALSLRTLSALTAASRREDRYGILILGEPSLGSVAAALLSALLALQHYVLMNTSTSRRTWMDTRLLRLRPNMAGSLSNQCVDEAAYALHDVALTCVYRVASAFGSSLVPEVARGAPPPYGSKAELTSLLTSCLAHLS